jgi:hypothetical protein
MGRRNAEMAQDLCSSLATVICVATIALFAREVLKLVSPNIDTRGDLLRSIDRSAIFDRGESSMLSSGAAEGARKGDQDASRGATPD